MGLIKDIVLAIPLGIIYNVFIHKLASLILFGMPYEEKYQKTIILLFIAGVVGIFIAQSIFSNNSYYKNRAMKYGLIFGSSLLLIYSLVTNWDKMDDGTKLILMGMIMVGLIWYCYLENDKPKKKKLKEKKVNFDDMDLDQLVKQNTGTKVE